METKFSVLLLLFFYKANLIFAETDVVLCYYQTYQNNVPPEDIDVNICTHVCFSFLGINEDGTLRLDASTDYPNRFAVLKERNPNVKLMFSVGGWGEGSVGFSHVAADSQKLEIMADNAVWYLQNYNFDGLDIDWEYPGKRGGSSQDKENFISMLRILRQKFDENGDYVLTTAVCSDPDCGDYDVPAITNEVNYVNVMSYAFSYENKTGQNSPLYAASTDTEWEREHTNCDAAIKNWFQRGTPMEKLILGLGFYGRAYTLDDPAHNGVGAPATGSDNGETYQQICGMTDGWTEKWDDVQKNPYKYKDRQWIGYDNPRSIGLKTQYAKSKSLGGVMMWAVDQDDTEGSCGPKNALLQAIKDNL